MTKAEETADLDFLLEQLTSIDGRLMGIELVLQFLIAAQMRTHPEFTRENVESRLLIMVEDLSSRLTPPHPSGYREPALATINRIIGQKAPREVEP